MKWICFFTGCLLYTTLQAQSLSGKVRNDGQPLEGATVVAKGANSTITTTSSNGSFHFKKLKPGTYKLSGSYAGFHSWEKQITLPQDSSVIIDLTPFSNMLQPVEVKALRAADNAPFAKTNIDKSFIEKNNLGQDIPFLLNQTPNVVVSSDAGNGLGYTYMRIRGSDATRINMTINGIPYNDAESQGTFFVNMPDFLSSVSSVQIQRGVGTSSNGAGAFGASMNFSTHEYNEHAYGELNNSYGSFNTWKNTIKFGSGLIDKHFTIDGRLSNLTSDGYVDRASSKLQGGFLSLAYWGKKTSLKFNLMLGKEKTYQAWNGITAEELHNNRTFNSAGLKSDGSAYGNETDNYWQNHYQLIFNHEFTSHLSFNTAAYLTTGKGYYEQYREADNLSDYGLPDQETDLIRRLWLNNKLYGQILSLQYQKNKLQITLGGGWSHYPGKHYGDIIWAASKPDFNYRWYSLNAKKTDANIYAKGSYKLTNHWNLFADFQLRTVHYQLNGFRKNPTLEIDKNWAFFNPKAGISYAKGNWSGFASYARGNKEPNRDDFEAGDSLIPKSEQLHDFELNIMRKNIVKGWSMGITFYAMIYKDQLALTGKINDVGAYTRSNIPSSYRTGAELETQYQFSKGSIKYNIAISKNRLRNFTEYIDDYDNGGQVANKYSSSTIGFSPALVQAFSAEYNIMEHGNVEWMGKHVSRQYLDNTGNKDRSLDAYFLNDLRFSYSIPFTKLLKEIKLVFQLNNALDVKYEPNGYTFSYVYGGALTTENYYFPMAGRNFMAAVNIRF